MGARSDMNRDRRMPSRELLWKRKEEKKKNRKKVRTHLFFLCVNG